MSKLHQYATAYCLLTYRTEDGTCETIWNARDGASPESILEQATGRRAEFVRGSEVYVPDYVPDVGSRVVTDMTDQMARVYACEMVELEELRLAAAGKPPLSEKFETRGKAVEDAKAYLLKAARTDITMVTSKFLEDLERCREAAEQPVAVIYKGKNQRQVEGDDKLVLVIDASELKPEPLPISRHMYDRNGKSITVERWLELLADAGYRELATTRIDSETTVLTSWLGVDHGVIGRPMIFETLIRGGRRNRDAWRAATQNEALRNHAEAVGLARKNAEDLQ